VDRLARHARERASEKRWWSWWSWCDLLVWAVWVAVRVERVWWVWCVGGFCAHTACVRAWEVSVVLRRLPAWCRCCLVSRVTLPGVVFVSLCVCAPL
jgi:hypothetical protein